MRLTDLTDEQRLLLLNVIEESYLFEVLNECAPGEDWPDRVPYIPHLAQIVEDFLDKGLLTLYRHSDEPGHPPIGIPDDQARAILADPDNWWSPNGTRPIALAPTDKGLALYRGTDVNAEPNRSKP